MRVRLLTTMAGPAGTAQPGQIVEVSEPTGREWIAGRYAEALAGEGIHAAPDPAEETAHVEPPETAVTRRGRPPGRR